MTVKNWILNAIDLWHSIKDEKLRWQTDNQTRQIQLKQARILAEDQLAGELKKKSVQLAHEITLLQTKNAAELAMFKIKCRQDIYGYVRLMSSVVPYCIYATSYEINLLYVRLNQCPFIIDIY